MSLSQKQKSIDALHAAATRQLGLSNILEASSRSRDALGTSLSAFSLSFTTLKRERVLAVENAYQGSKIFEDGHGNASLNRLHYQEGKFALGTILAAVFPHAPGLISARFLFEYLSAFKDELLVSRMTGTANVTLAIGGISEVPIPLVCPEVQKKVDEFMTLCDQLERARTEREATRDRLAAASLARLNAPDPETFQDDARFALGALPAMTARPDQVKELRQTIMSLAMRGKLVPHDRNDKPVPFSGCGSVGNGDQEAAKLDGPFSLPSGWRWSEFGQLASFENGDRGKNYPNRDEYVEKGVAWINTGHINPDGSLSVTTMNYITRAKYASLRGGKTRPGDLVYCLRGATFGKTAFVEPFVEGAIASSLMIVRPGPRLDRRFTFFYLISPIGRSQLLRFDNGTAQPNLSSGNVKKYFVPVRDDNP